MYAESTNGSRQSCHAFELCFGCVHISCCPREVLFSPYFKWNLAGRVCPEENVTDRSMLKQTKERRTISGRVVDGPGPDQSVAPLLPHFQQRSRVTPSTPRIASFSENMKQQSSGKGHCYIVAPEHGLSYHFEAEPPRGEVKADFSACPSRVVLRYHSIFIPTIVRVPAGVKPRCSRPETSRLKLRAPRQ